MEGRPDAPQTIQKCFLYETTTTYPPNSNIFAILRSGQPISAAVNFLMSSFIQSLALLSSVSRPKIVELGGYFIIFSYKNTPGWFVVHLDGLPCSVRGRLALSGDRRAPSTVCLAAVLLRLAGIGVESSRRQFFGTPRFQNLKNVYIMIVRNPIGVCVKYEGLTPSECEDRSK